MSVERVERTYVVAGATVRPPRAGGKGEWSMRVRLRMIRDGIVECLAFCPQSDRVLMTQLQIAWVEAERAMRTLPAVPDAVPVLPFGCEEDS